MSQPLVRSAAVWALCVALASLSGCGETTSPPPPIDAALPPPCLAEHAADILFVVDNSNTMYDNQRRFMRNFGSVIDALTDGEPATALRDLHIGVITTDLGTPGSVVPSCSSADVGDDGLLNPTRNGPSTRVHPLWNPPPGDRPARCTTNPEQYPSFLNFDATIGDRSAFAEAFVCVAFTAYGCGLEQQLESVRRALITHGASTPAGGGAPNAGFVRDNALLGIFMLSDEEDGSTRDCRHAEAGMPCTDATRVFDIMSPDWASPDLNLRFYMYTPGSQQDPTWPLDRYFDLANPARGYLSLKPGHPERVVFGAITGVPLTLPTLASGAVDWTTLLGRSPDGSDGYVGESFGGPISMRQRTMDPMCSTRVVPACRREDAPPVATCDSGAQYFAWPARRIAEVARRFDERYHNGVISSICANDYAAPLREFAARLRSHVCQ